MDIGARGINSLNVYNDANIKNLVKQTNNIQKQDNDKLREASDAFESFFLQQMLTISAKNLNIAGEATGSKIIKGMYIETLAQTSTGTLGVSDMIYNYIKEQQKDLVDPKDLLTKNNNKPAN